MEDLIFLLFGILIMIVLLCMVEGLVWIWEKLDPPAKVEEVRTHADHRYTR